MNNTVEAEIGISPSRATMESFPEQIMITLSYAKQAGDQQERGSLSHMKGGGVSILLTVSSSSEAIVSAQCTLVQRRNGGPGEEA